MSLFTFGVGRVLGKIFVLQNYVYSVKHSFILSHYFYMHCGDV